MNQQRRTPYRTPTFDEGVVKSDNLPPAVYKDAQAGALPVLRQRPFVREFWLNKKEDLAEYVSVLQLASNNAAVIRFLDRQWVPEERTHIVICEWTTGFLDAPTQQGVPNGA